MFTVHSAKIRFYDCEVDVFEFFDGLQLDDNGALYEKIEPMSTNLLSIIFDRHLDLFLNPQVSFLKLDDQCTFVDRFEKTGSQPLMNLDRRSDNLIGQGGIVPSFPGFLASL